MSPVKPTTPLLASLLRHLGILGIGVLALLLAFGGAVALLAHTAAAPDRTGRLTALFPLDWSADRRLLAAIEAGTIPVRAGWFPGSLELVDDSGGGTERLQQNGAYLVLSELPLAILAVGGCSTADIARFPDRPATRKLAAGPM